MKAYKKQIALVLAGALALGSVLTGTGAMAKKSKKDQKQPVLSTQTAMLAVGASRVIKVKQTAKPVKWKVVSGKSAIVLQRKGKKAVKVTGKAVGTARLRAVTGKKKLYCRVIVQDSKTDAYMNSEYKRYTFQLLSAVLKKKDSAANNAMISPASVMMALDLTAAGAGGNTLMQLTELFAKGADPTAQQTFASSFMERINRSEDVIFSCANGVWSNQAIIGDTLQQGYQEKIRTAFDAQIRSMPFDNAAVNEINAWVNEKTRQMIPKIVDQLSPDIAMLLVNAIAFEGKWSEQYQSSQIRKESFTNAAGEKEEASLLYGRESNYYESEKATGFLKYYRGGQYGFLVMLPKDEKLSGDGLLAGMTGEDYQTFADSRTNAYDVDTKLPKFAYDYDVSMEDLLQELGVTDAFSPELADFTGIAAPPSGKLYLSKVLHKTHIELDENGTKAAAVTAVIAKVTAVFNPKERKQVYCDRPFAYAIVDTETMNPIFIGTVNTVK